MSSQMSRPGIKQADAGRDRGGMGCRQLAQPARWLTRTLLTPPLSACRHLMTGEVPQCCRLLDGYGPVVHLNPSPSLEGAQRGIDALPGASDLMREFFLGQIKLDDAVLTWGLGEQHLGDAAGQVE